MPDDDYELIFQEFTFHHLHEYLAVQLVESADQGIMLHLQALTTLMAILATVNELEADPLDLSTIDDEVELIQSALEVWRFWDAVQKTRLAGGEFTVLDTQVNES